MNEKVPEKFRYNDILYICLGDLPKMDSGNLSKIKITFQNDFVCYAYYCREYERFIIQYDNFNVYLKTYGYFPVRTDFITDNMDETKYYELREKSPLFLCGYHVREKYGLSDEERQKRLGYILDQRILSKQVVIDYLSSFIAKHEDDFERKEDRQKWIYDRNFVYNYYLSKHPMETVGTIETL